MLLIPEILNKLHQLPDKFEQDCAEKKWHAAAMDYENAVVVSRFIEMDYEAREKLLNRFQTEVVEEVYKKAGWYEEGTHADRIRNRKEAV